MYNGTFFAKFEFKDNVSGFFADVEAVRLYSFDYEDDYKRLVNDVLRVMKKRGGTVTFEYFNICSTDMLRVVSNDNGMMRRVYWERNAFGDVKSVSISDDIDISKATVRHAVDFAIEIFKRMEDDAK